MHRILSRFALFALTSCGGESKFAYDDTAYWGEAGKVWQKRFWEQSISSATL